MAARKTTSQLTYLGGNPFGSGSASSGGAATSGGPFVTSPLTTPKPVTGSGNFGTVPGKYDVLRATLKAQNPGIPASFIDDEIDNLNKGRTRQDNSSPIGTIENADPNNPAVAAAVSQTINKEWQSESDRSRYESTDTNAQAAAKTSAGIDAARTDVAAIPQQNAQAINAFYSKYVTPSYDAVAPANAAVKAADLTAEGNVANLTQNYTNTLNTNAAQRLGDTTNTNNYVTDLSNQLRSASDQTNQANSGLASNLWNATNSTNASNSGLASGLWDAANSTNADQSAALSALQGNISSSNAQQNAALAQVQGQFSQLNASDQAAYMQYLQETNPLMAQLVAQGSDPQDIAAQRDVMQRYKDLSNPEVTAQERLIASQARQKFESDDRSNREAVQQQLLGRGLNSGGLQIAGMQSAHEQTANDRMNAEMGLEANAVQRGLVGLAGYGNEANTIRSADDAERNFEDQFHQNEEVRVGNLAQQRNNQSLATNQAITNRDQMGFNDATTSINNNFARDYTGYQARTQTNEDNFGRTQAATQNNEWVNQTNLGNTQQATNVNLGVNQTNLGNTGMAIGNQQAVAGDNWNRMDSTGGALAQNDLSANNVLNANTASAMLPVNNRQREQSNALGTASTMSGVGATMAGVQSGLTNDQYTALARALGLDASKTATNIAGGAAGMN